MPYLEALPPSSIYAIMCEEALSIQDEAEPLLLGFQAEPGTSGKSIDSQSNLTL
jgi:hypothetical protein